MRILLLSEMFPPDFDGGQEVNAEKAANGLRERGHHVIVATAQFRTTYVGQSDTREWVKRIFKHGPQMYATKSPLERILAAKNYSAEVKIHEENLQAMRDLLKSESFDVVYAFGLFRIGLSLTVAATENNIPILWHQGGNNLENRLLQLPSMGRIAKHYRLKQVEEFHLDLRFLAYVSQFLVDDSSKRGFVGQDGRGSGFVQIIPRGIEFPVRHDIGRIRTQPPVLLMVGRITAIKGFHDAIEALHFVHTSNPELDWQLHIIGEADDQDVQDGILGSEYLAQLKGKVSEYGLGEKVKFLGRKSRKEVLEHMTLATAFLSASICGEAFANTIIETLASGTPLIVSNDGSALEVVTPEESALVFESHDVATLAAQIERVLSEPILRQSLAKSGVERIEERYTIARILDLTEATLQRAIDSNDPQAV